MKRGRKIPKEQNRTARDKLVGVYFAKEELVLLEKKRLLKGYATNSAYIVDVMNNYNSKGGLHCDS